MTPPANTEPATTEPVPVRIFDTTLRDGEQSPGASLNHAEKLKIAHQLEALNVDVIEAGFPITSDGDFEAVSAIAKEVRKPIICGLARCVSKDIERAGEAVKHAERGRVHVFCATSKIHREHKLKKAFDQIIELSVKSIQQARGYVDDVEFSPEDGSRTELDYLVQITGAAIDAGATTINIPDTVGFSVPAEYGHIFAHLRQQLPIIDEQDIYLSCHCHNDLGLAVANSLAAVQNGARQIECTVNGIGERAGNAALEELVMAMRTRGGDGHPYHRFTNCIDISRIYPTSRMVSSMTGLLVQRNKAVIGENAFAHESGIHQDGMLKNRNTYEIMDPTSLGVPASKLVLGKHSGRHALKDRITELGYTLDDELLRRVYDDFKALADKKKDVYDEDIEAILDRQLEAERELWSMLSFQVTSGTNAIATATVVVKDSSGMIKQDAATGDGPLDAIFSAIQRITGVEATLEDYTTRAITGGKEAQGEAQIRLNHHGKTVRGRGVSTDVIEAAAQAYLGAINRIRTAEARAVAPTTMGNGDAMGQP